MAEIDWNKLYNDYKTQYKDPFKAAEYTVFGRLTGSKKVPTTYTQDEWYQYEAPDYWAVISKPAASDDPLAETTKKIKTAKSPSDVFAIANSAPTSAIGVGKLFREFSDYRDYLMGLYNQKVQAEKKATSTSANWWKQYGLPDPSKRFASLEQYAKTGTGDVFSEGKKYIVNQSGAYKKKLIASGVSEADATARAKDYAIGLGRAIDKKIADAGLTPFLIAAQQRIKARG